MLSFGCTMFKADKVDHKIHIFDFGAGLMPDAIPDTILPKFIQAREQH